MGIADKMKQALGGEDTADRAKDAKDAPDKAKGKTGQVSGKASQMGDMGDRAKGMVDKGGDKVDQMTHGKASSQVDSAQGKAKDIIDDKMPGS